MPDRRRENPKAVFHIGSAEGRRSAPDIRGAKEGLTEIVDGLRAEPRGTDYDRRYLHMGQNAPRMCRRCGSMVWGIGQHDRCCWGRVRVWLSRRKPAPQSRPLGPERNDGH